MSNQNTIGKKISEIKKENHNDIKAELEKEIIANRKKNIEWVDYMTVSKIFKCSGNKLKKELHSFCESENLEWEEYKVGGSAYGDTDPYNVIAFRPLNQ